jgi:hypothetical protein
VNSSIIFRWILVIALVLSVAWKSAIRSDIENDAREHLVVFLKRNHFDVSPIEQIVDDVSMIRAQTASCDLKIVQLAPNGSNRDLFRSLATGADHAFVVFRGQVYTRQPILWTVLDDFWVRHLRELGVTTHSTPVFAVATNSACDAERIPWSELREES